MILADFGSYTVEDTKEKVLSHKRELKRLKKKADREATLAAYIGSSIMFLAVVSMIATYIAMA